jgi:hypothetical protein
VTLDEALARAGEQLDAMLEERRDRRALKMIADGANPNDCGELDADPPPEGLPEGLTWERTTFDAVLAEQRAIDVLWREATIADLRAQLQDVWTE